MLTRWSIGLQSFDFTVKHKPGKLHVVPDTLSRLFVFENEQDRLTHSLAPICRNVPDDPKLHTSIPNRPFQVSPNKLDSVQPVLSDRELFTVDTNVVSATEIFQSVDHDKLCKQQAKNTENISDTFWTTTHRYHIQKRQPQCRTILSRTDCFSSHTCPDTSGNVARSMIN